MAKGGFKVLSQWLLPLALLLSYIGTSVAKPASAPISGSVNFNLLLADKVKSSDPEQFNAIVANLATQLIKLTSIQRHRLAYLQTYQLAYQGKYQAAIAQGAIVQTSSAPETIKLKTQLTLINAYGFTQRWREGFVALFSISNRLDSITNQDLIDRILAAITVMHINLGEYQTALEYAEQLHQQTNSNRVRCFAGEYIINAQFNIDIPAPSSQQITQSINDCERVGEQLIVAVIHSDIAEAMLKQGQHSKAADYIIEHLKSAQNARYPILMAKIYSTLAQASFASNKQDEAKVYAEIAISVTRDAPTTQYFVNSLHILYQIAASEQDWQTALGYLERYTKANIAYLDEVQAKRLGFELAKHQALNQQQKLTRLSTENDTLTVSAKLAVTEVANTRLVIAFLLALLLAGLIWVYKSRSVKERLITMSQYDQETGVFSRSQFIEVARSALKYCQHSEQELSLVIFEFDDFGLTDDKYSPESVLWVLRRALECCQVNIRSNDKIGRLSENQFAMVLPGTDVDVAFNIAQKCQQQIAAIDTVMSGSCFDVVVSAGVSNTLISGFHFEKMIHDVAVAIKTSQQDGGGKVIKFKDNH